MVMKYSGSYGIKSGLPGKKRKEEKVVGIKEVGIKKKSWDKKEVGIKKNSEGGTQGSGISGGGA